MNTIGAFINQSRREKKLTLDDLAQKTRIKKEFLRNLEQERWDNLPEYAVVLGFVKSIAGFLDIPENKAVALLRRDYPPKKVAKDQPKPDLPREFRWSPRLTFLAGVLVVIVFVAVYLGVQYTRFVKPPELEISQPTQDQIIDQRTLIVQGVTDSDASVQVNNQPALVSDDGHFEAEINVNQNTQEIVVEAVSRSGKKTSIKLPIKVELKDR